MRTIARFVPPPSPSIAIQHIALASRAINYTRAFTTPTEPLGVYVLGMDAQLSDDIAPLIPFTRGAPHPRVATDDNHIAVGWAPLTVLADVVARFSRDEAELLRAAPGSDVNVWTVLYVGVKTITVMRVAREDLVAIDCEDVECAADPLDPVEVERMPPTDDGSLVFPALTGPCEWGGGEHDGGTPYVEFYEDGDVFLMASSCTKCWKNAVPRFDPRSEGAQTTIDGEDGE